MAVCSLGNCISVAGGFYNLVLAVLLIIIFIIFLRSPSKKIYLKPWKLLLFAISVYFIEEISQILLNVVGWNIPVIIFPIYEMIMITTFIYMLLLQKDFMKTGKKRVW